MKARDEATPIDVILSALADPTRRAVVDLLRRSPRRAGVLAETLGMSPPALSRHLRVLRRSGLVEERSFADDARVREYRLRREPFAELRSWAQDVEAYWGEQLSAFKAHAEATRGPNRDRGATATSTETMTEATGTTNAGGQPPRPPARSRPAVDEGTRTRRSKPSREQVGRRTRGSATKKRVRKARSKP